MAPPDCYGFLDWSRINKHFDSSSLHEGSIGTSSNGEAIGTVMKKFRTLVYRSILVLGVTGIVMNLLNKNYLGPWQFTNLWSWVTLIKHIFTAVLVILVIYAFEGLFPFKTMPNHAIVG